MAVYEIAGIRFQTELSDAYTKQYIDAYRVDAEQAEENIEILPEDIDFERSIQPHASVGVLNACALLRKLSKRMLYHYNGILLHAAAILYQGKAYLFVAPSGTGKTTHIMLWKKCLGDRMQILNGDKPFLRLQDGRITVYGSPWQGKEGYGINASGPLGGIFLLNRGQENTVRPATVPEVIRGLVAATVFPQDLEGRNKVLDFVERICKNTPVGVLHCNMEEEAVYTVQSFIHDNEKQC